MSAEFVKLCQLLAAPPISIEILPGDSAEWLGEGDEHAPFLFLEGNLGVPKKLAYRLYLESVQLFRHVRERLRTHSQTAATDALSDVDVADVLASSSVLLLVNPAHQSALNARKRLVQHEALDATQELRFVAALLTLHEGAKQSILWHHRRWLLRYTYPIARPLSGFSAAGIGCEEDSLSGLLLDSDAFHTEFATVAQACELYPRNYHAWAHRYICAEALAARLRGDTGRLSGTEFTKVWEQEKTRIREWIERHVSDYSAMQYACRLEDLDRGLRERQGPVDDGAVEETLSAEKESVCEHAWSLVQTYPSHESLWLYLRGALRSPSRPFVLHAAIVPTPDRVRAEACAFAEQVLSDGRTISGSPEYALVRSHATRFLAWILCTDGHSKFEVQNGVACFLPAWTPATGCGDGPVTDAQYL